MADEKLLQHTLELARGCTHRGQPYQAFGHLTSIQSDIDDLAGHPIWVEHELVYAGTLAGIGSPDALGVFEETFKRLAELIGPNSRLEMKAHRDFAKYFAESGDFRNARGHYRAAEQIADDLNLEEDAASIQMCVILLDLREAGSPLLSAFQKLREAAKDGYTAVEQRDAWIHYTEEIGAAGKQLVAARKGSDATVDYFRGVLSEIRRSRR